jgi:integrase
MIDRYCREVLPKKSRSMARNQAIQLAWWKDRIGEELIGDVMPPLIVACKAELERHRTHLKKPRSPASVNRYLAALSHCFTKAVRQWQWLETNPLLRVDKEKESRERVRYLSEDELSRLLTACKESRNPKLYPVVLLALSTGCRRDEILGLRVSDVDLLRRVVRLRDTKNAEPRAVPLTGPAVAVIHELLRTQPQAADLLFARRDGKRPVNIRAVWERALTTAKIENFHFHDLRHTCASYLAMNSATLPEIAAVLGHKTYEMVKRYAHLTEQHTAGVLERMTSRLFTEASKTSEPSSE